MEKDQNKSTMTLLVGASENPERYAFSAAQLLQQKGFPFIPIGIKKGNVLGQDILDLQQKPALKEIHTLSLYIGPKNQEQWMDYLLSLHPKRIIFNPGTENPTFYTRAKAAGIEALNACTLVMLTTSQY
jgi:uncharacterized protein